jgi:hypothetical protein
MLLSFRSSAFWQVTVIHLTQTTTLECVAFVCFTQSLGWRTMLVVPELEQELAVGEATRATQFELKMLRNARSDLDTQVRAVQLQHACMHISTAAWVSAVESANPELCLSCQHSARQCVTANLPPCIVYPAIANQVLRRQQWVLKQGTLNAHL